jgi:hypothetical protein
MDPALMHCFALWCAGRPADGSDEEDDSEGSDSESQGQEASPAPRFLAPFQPSGSILEPAPVAAPVAAAVDGTRKAAPVMQEVWKAATGALPRNSTLFSFRTNEKHAAWWEQVRCMDFALPSLECLPEPIPSLLAPPCSDMQAAEKRHDPQWGKEAWYLREGYEEEFRTRMEAFAESE